MSQSFNCVKDLALQKILPAFLVYTLDERLIHPGRTLTSQKDDRNQDFGDEEGGRQAWESMVSVGSFSINPILPIEESINTTTGY